MMIMLKYILIFQLFTTVNGSFNLYDTNVAENYDYEDCLYSFTSKSSINEWQLVPYCIRYNPGEVTTDSKRAYILRYDRRGRNSVYYAQ